MVGLGFGRKGAGVEWLVDQVAQHVCLLGDIDGLALLCELLDWLLIVDP